MVLNHQDHKRSILFVSTGLFIVALGLIALFGWILNVGVLKSVFPAYATMKFNTSLCFIVSGVSFLLTTTRNSLPLKSLLKLLLFSFGGFALISISQDIFHYSAGIDQFFIADHHPAAPGYFQGRLSPSTALCFALLAISLWNINAKGAFYKNIAQYLSHDNADCIRIADRLFV